MFEYMTEYERESAIFNAKVENAFMKIDFAFECVYREHEIRMNGIEAESYMIESSNELSDMYARENEVFTEALKDAWEGFKKFIGGILDKIKELLGIATEKAKDSSGETVEVPMDVNAAVKDQDKMLHVLRNWASFSHPDGKANVPKILAYAAAGAAVSGATIYGIMKKKTSEHKGKKFRINKDQIKKLSDDTLKKVDELKSLVNDGAKNAGATISSEFKDIVKSLTDSMTAFAQSLTNAARKGSDADKTDEPKVKGNDTSARNKLDPEDMQKPNSTGKSADGTQKGSSWVLNRPTEFNPQALKVAFSELVSRSGMGFKRGDVIPVAKLKLLKNYADGPAEQKAMEMLCGEGIDIVFESVSAFDDLMSLIESL